MLRNHYFSLLKNLVFKQLSKIKMGLIVFHDGDELTFFGDKKAALRASLHVMDKRFYSCVIFAGTTGAGEAYSKGHWKTDQLTALIQIFLLNRKVINTLDSGLATSLEALRRLGYWRRRNTEQGSRKNIRSHYDLGNDFFKTFLDPSLMYSCAMYPAVDTPLNEAAIIKLDTICRKLQLNSHDHVLEIGTGWGGFAIHAANYYGCKVTTTTISDQQYEYARQRIQQAKLEDHITLLKQDYRHLSGVYDKLVSIEMIEAVGANYYETFFSACHRLLKPQGVFLLQGIVIQDQLFDAARKSVDFIKHSIFPGSCIPSLTALMNAATKASDLRAAYIEDIGYHYAKTLRDWRKNFKMAQAHILQMGYAEEFIRLWEFYLSYCEAGFLERTISDLQILWLKPECRLQWPLSAASQTIAMEKGSYASYV